MSTDELRRALRQVTAARVLLGRAGPALPTRAWLEFQLAHARARDAVQAPCDLESLAQALRARAIESVIVHSQATDRTTYLTRPDLGRLPDDDALRTAQALARERGPIDVAIVASGGLSATALHRHGEPLLLALQQALRGEGLVVGPVLLVEQGRVALADPLAEALGARLALVVIGERPGLSVHDSLGIYLTYAPRSGRSDAERNCVSNVRPPGGLDYHEAAKQVAWLATEALRRGLSGVELKPDAGSLLAPAPGDDARSIAGE